MIEFRLNPGSGLSPYLQIVKQVRQALQLGLIEPGDQLPTVKEVVGALAINPNTVLKAYQALEHQGLVEGRQGQGTFVRAGLPGPSPMQLARLRRGLDTWLRHAGEAGLDHEGVLAMVERSLRDLDAEASA